MYVKPGIKKIRLTIKEAVLAICKTATGDTAKLGDCKTAATGACCKESQGS